MIRSIALISALAVSSAVAGPAASCSQQASCVDFNIGECSAGSRTVCIVRTAGAQCTKSSSDTISHMCPSEGGSKVEGWAFSDTTECQTVTGGSTAVFGVKDGSTCSGTASKTLSTGSSATCSGPGNVCAGGNTKECKWEVPVPLCSGGQGDPHFMGFDGTSYDFQGVPNATFNIISEKNTLINAYFVDASIVDQWGTYMEVIGIKSFGEEFSFTPESDGHIVVEYNGNVVEKNVVTANNNHLTFETGSTVKFTNGIFEIKVEAMVLGDNFVNLDIYASVLRMPEEAHGVLGQTLNAYLDGHRLSMKPWNDAADVLEYTQTAENSYDDYMVSDLFESDFPFNLFVGDETVAPNAAFGAKREAIVVAAFTSA